MTVGVKGTGPAQLPIYYCQRNGSGYRRTNRDIEYGYLEPPSTRCSP